jgi:DNA-binding CsgD family transcriptional regulator
MDLLALQFADEWNDKMPLTANLDTLLPHLSKVVEINRTFTLLRQRYQAALAALDHVKVGMSVVSPAGAILIANREAQRIHDLDDGLKMARIGQWCCGTSEATAGLARNIKAVSATACGEGDDREILMFVERKSGKRPFMLEFAPLRDATGELEGSFYGAIVLIVDPENQRAVSVDRIAKLFGLTEAEADVCRLMVGAHSSAEIAEMRNVSEGTVKTQFKAIYAKTGVHRRAELLRLAITVDPPIEAPAEPHE